MSQPTTHPDVRDLYPPLGELLARLAAEEPQAVGSGVCWSIGYMPTGVRGIRGGVLADDATGSVLDRLAALIGGETRIRPYGDSYEQADGSRWRLHMLHARYRGIPVEITTARPEPTEREALLARLAELDAAEGGGPR